MTMDSFGMAIAILVMSLFIRLVSLRPDARYPVTSHRWPLPGNGEGNNTLELGMTQCFGVAQCCCAVLNMRVAIGIWKYLE
jgi:hypothetical protein